MLLFRNKHSLSPPPPCTLQGAVLGLLSGLVVALWVGIGAQIYPPPAGMSRPLELSTAGCNLSTGVSNWSRTDLPHAHSSTFSPESSTLTPPHISTLSPESSTYSPESSTLTPPHSTFSPGSPESIVLRSYH